jgi:hypothetical protein
MFIATVAYDTPADHGGLTTEACTSRINSIQYTILNSVYICWFVLIIARNIFIFCVY